MSSAAELTNSHNTRPGRGVPRRAAQVSASMAPFRTVLVGFDFSNASQAAMAAAADFCQHSGARLKVLHVLEYGPLPVDAADCTEYIAGLVQAQQRKLQPLIQDLRKQGIKAQPLVETGHPPTVILERIQQGDVDLVVLGTPFLSEELCMSSRVRATAREAISSR